jgi:LAS superfamily LD-carboxypeptidase LdcB
LPDFVTVFDEYPGITNLDPGLLTALREAASEARAEGVEFYVNSGWRSEEYQERLMSQAVAEHGSEEEAAKWVAPARTSRHVSGDAVDLGPDEARDWLAGHGPAYGLCRVYLNEPWHFESRPEAKTKGCPEMYADATADPRLR